MTYYLLLRGRAAALLYLAVLTAGSGFAQTNNCNDNAAGQLTVGASCTPVPFNTQDNVNWWTGAATFGTCDEWFGDAWMWFDATSTSTTITYDPAIEDAVLTIFQGACNASGPSVACSDAAGYGGAETITLPTVPGTRYHIRIENYWGNTDMAGTICATSAAAGGPTTASDCAIATNICTNLTFSIDPNGFGTIDEIPAAGSFGNPDINPASGNAGCLLIGEYNSTWMIINVATTGNLEFTFGGNGAQAGYFDWIMYPYAGAATCTGIMSNTVAPVRCNWNGVSYGGTGLNDVPPAGGDVSNFEPPLPVTAGQRYIICFSNYSNLATTVPLQFVTGPGNSEVSCVPLGFSMEGLAVECVNDSRQLTWNSVINNTVDKFVVEKSRDNANWEAIGTVYNGIEKDGKMHYSLLDESALPGVDYYRLLQFSDDGGMMTSAVLSADCDDDDDLYRIYPNPSTGLMNLEYESMSDAELSFFDIYGNCVFKQALERSVNRKTVQIHAAGIPEGMYLYRLTTESGLRTGTVIIRN
jgi:hypothetical protein